MIGRINNARAKFEEYQKDRDNAKGFIVSRKRELSAFKCENQLLTTAAEVRCFGETMIKPGIKYYIDNVLTPGGSLYTIRKGYRAVRIFDPLFINKSGIPTLQEHIESL